MTTRIVLGLFLIGFLAMGCEDKAKKEADMKAKAEAEKKRIEDSIKAATPPPPPPATVSSIKLGKEVNAANPTTEFKPKDTVFLSVMVENGKVGDMLAATWSSGGKTIRTDSVALAKDGSGMSEFRLANPKGMPVGDYKVDVSLNGQTQQSASFKVVR